MRDRLRAAPLFADLDDDVSRTARVRAETDVRCLAIARPELERLFAEVPQLADRLRQLSA